MKYHYVYKIVEEKTGYYYIGSRTSNVEPHLDSYMGSPKVWKPNKKDIQKFILKKDFKTRTEALKYEANIIKECFTDKLNQNYNIHSDKFTTIGVVIMKDRTGNIVITKPNDERIEAGDLVGVVKGFVNVKDKNGNTFQVHRNDKRYLTGEYVGVNKGLKIVRHKKTNTYHWVDDLSDEYEFSWVGKSHSEETKRKMSEAKKGKGNGKANSQFGTIWITNGTENKKIKKEEIIPIGWKSGRVLKK
jgi:hypothetical protein